MKKILYQLITFILIILFVPYIITTIMTGNYASQEEIVPYDGRIVIMEHENFTENVDYSQYLVGIVARSLLNFDETVFDTPEFLKLNCVIANTFLNNEFAENNSISDTFLTTYHISDEKLRNYWGENYNLYIEKIQTALNETNNLIITCNNTPIKPYHHFISNGITRISPDAEVYPYLKSVNTNKDLEEPGFLCVTSYSETDFIKKINEIYPDSGLSITNSANPLNQNEYTTTNLRENLQIINRDDSGYVTQIQIGNILMSGDDFTVLMELNSPAFTITFQENSLKIITKGIGHGYGISLSYAFRLAKEGNTYSDIISFFYNNVTITSLK